MFAVVVRESGDGDLIDKSGEMVRARVAPVVSGAPGFVSAVWLSDGAGHTLNVLTFDTEESARAATEAARAAQRPPFMTLDTVDLMYVLATA